MVVVVIVYLYVFFVILYYELEGGKDCSVKVFVDYVVFDLFFDLEEVWESEWLFMVKFFGVDLEKGVISVKESFYDVFVVGGNYVSLFLYLNGWFIFFYLFVVSIFFIVVLFMFGFWLLFGKLENIVYYLVIGLLFDLMISFVCIVFRLCMIWR